MPLHLSSRPQRFLVWQVRVPIARFYAFSRPYRQTNRLSSEKTGHCQRLITFSTNGSRPEANGTSLDPQLQLRQLYASVFGAGFERELGDELLEQIKALPGTHDYYTYLTRAVSLAKWKHALEKGILPRDDEIDWPAEPFRSKFSETLQKIEMLRFTRRYPKFLNSLLSQMVELAHGFEKAMIEMENDNESQSPPSQPPTPSERSSSASQNGNGDPSQNGDSDPSQTEGQLQQGEGQEGEGQTIEVQLSQAVRSQQEIEKMKAELEKIAEELVDRFEEDMAPVMDNLEKAKNAFLDLDDLLDDEKGFAHERGIWRRTGWHEVEKLRRKLDDLMELRELVRSLGRSGGRGPKRKAPAQASKWGNPPGVVRSPLQPEETTGLCRSGDLSRMLPSEAALMAVGWPRNADRSDDEAHRKISRAARLLHLARRAERNLLSYERSGWLENEPSRVLKHLEYRPAAEQGPIIVCLDTSGSMMGARETVAKALVLECLRGAHRQSRCCYLYAFSSYGDIKEMELSIDLASIPRLLDFLEHSFHGGTDVTGALERAVALVQKEEWAQADILIVTDGEMPMPGGSVVDTMRQLQDDIGLEVHGLLVSDTSRDTLRGLCSHLHVFRSWDVINGGNRRR